MKCYIWWSRIWPTSLIIELWRMTICFNYTRQNVCNARNNITKPSNVDNKNQQMINMKTGIERKDRRLWLYWANTNHLIKEMIMTKWNNVQIVLKKYNKLTDKFLIFFFFTCNNENTPPSNKGGTYWYQWQNERY